MTPALSRIEKALILSLALILGFPADLMAQREPVAADPIVAVADSVPPGDEVWVDAELAAEVKPHSVTADDYKFDENGKIPFNPNPERAVWLSALCPGLGQLYNRRYWKLPIVVGGFMGLGYATSWNSNQYQDYSNGYRDLLDDDPDTKSYMNFFPPTTSEEDLDKTWLQQVLKSRKDYFRRNRDLCIICVALLYLICMVDAYVDASLAHFDISPSLSLDLQPTLWRERSGATSLGLNWAFNF